MIKKEDLIIDILQVIKISNLNTTGDVFFSLAFRSENELIEIARDLNIKV